jgi:hypothetical protein
MRSLLFGGLNRKIQSMMKLTSMDAMSISSLTLWTTDLEMPVATGGMVEMIDGRRA